MVSLPVVKEQVDIYFGYPATTMPCLISMGEVAVRPSVEALLSNFS